MSDFAICGVGKVAHWARSIPVTITRGGELGRRVWAKSIAATIGASGAQCTVWLLRSSRWCLSGGYRVSETSSNSRLMARCRHHTLQASGWRCVIFCPSLGILQRPQFAGTTEGHRTVGLRMSGCRGCQGLFVWVEGDGLRLKTPGLKGWRGRMEIGCYFWGAGT